ncbi:MAG: hypothetical protein RLZZ244_3135 [Verrucomicrobiota bacterium]|jgi:hypothetical protein
MPSNRIAAIAASGVNAATVRAEAAASNLANLQTPGAPRLEVVQQEVPGGGVEARARMSAERPDAVQGVVEQRVALYTLKANMVTLKIVDEMLGQALNAKA